MTTNPTIEEVAKKFAKNYEIHSVNSRHLSFYEKVELLNGILTESNTKLLDEIDKWQNGKFAELGDDFGENPITLIQLLKKQSVAKNAEIAELKKGMLDAVEFVKELFALLDANILVRNTDNDGDVTRFMSGSFRITKTLQKGQAILSTAEKL